MQMTDMSKVMEGTGALKANLSFQVTMICHFTGANKDTHKLTSSGEGHTLTVAKDAAASLLYKQLKPLVERNKKERMEAKAKDKLREKAAFTQTWISAATLAVQPSMIIYPENEEVLRAFVDDQLAQAKTADESQQAHYLGMDSEGHSSNQAKYMQIAGAQGKINVAVVFQTTPEMVSIVKALFVDKRITIIVADLKAECVMLKDLFHDESWEEWKQGLVDVQPIAQQVMRCSPAPSLPAMVQYLRKSNEMPSKFYKHTTDIAKMKAYAPFESQDVPLPDDLIVYAGLDALVTKWAFLKFQQAPQAPENERE